MYDNTMRILSLSLFLCSFAAFGQVTPPGSSICTYSGTASAGQVLTFTSATACHPTSVSGTGDVLGPATNTANFVPQWNGANSKTLKNGLGLSGTGTTICTTTGCTMVNSILTAPFIADFTNATHNHTNAAGGGQLTDAALSAAVGIAKGGTGQVTQQAGFDALAPTGSAAGDITYWNGTHYVNLAGNASGTKVLQETSSGVPSWVTGGGGGTGCVPSGSVNQILTDSGSGTCTSTAVTIDSTAGRAGSIALPQGTAGSPAANTILDTAPTSVTAYTNVRASTVGVTGVDLVTVASTTATHSFGLVPLTAVAAEAADTLLMNATGGSASPTAVAMPTSGTNGCAGTSDALKYNTTTHALGCNTITAGGGTGTSVTSITPVTVTANTTSDQSLMELALSAGYLNSAKQPFLFNGAGVYTTPVGQTPTLTFKIKLCTISGCGSGTVVTLVSIVSTATLASSTNNNWNFSIMGYTATAGASGNLEIHGPLSVDLGALTTTADSIFNDVNTAVSGNIDLTAALFVDFTVATSTGSASNSITQRQGGIMPFAATAAPVTSVFNQTGAVGNLSGDCTTSNSLVVTCRPGSTVPGTSVTLAGSSQIFTCTSTCTVTVPVPALNVQYCVMNDDNVSTVITLTAIGSSARYENTARTAYGTAGTGTFVSGGAVGDAVCINGRDSTHYLTVSSKGIWTVN